MPTVNIDEASSSFSELIAAAEAGEVVIIARGGRPVAQLGPVDTAHRPVVFGDLKGRVRIAEDFDAWLDQDECDWFGR